jgi:hypothetical protein
MRIEYRDGKTYLDQVPYLEKILKRFGMANAKAAQTPLPTQYFSLLHLFLLDSRTPVGFLLDSYWIPGLQ